MKEHRITGSSRNLEFSTFSLGGAVFGINILDIREINKQSEVTRVPHSPDYIEGILNLRGRIVTIIDLGKKLGLSPVQKDKSNRNIIVNFEDETVGLMVDAIGDVVIVRGDGMDPVPSNIGGLKAKNFQGVLKNRGQLIGILDIDAVLKE